MLGLDSYRSALDVYCDKLGIGLPKKADGAAPIFGREFERYALVYFRDIYQIPLRQNVDLFVSTEHPHRRCTPDALEIMNDRVERTGQLKLAGLKDGWEDDRIPERYYAQVQYEMGVLGLEEGRIMAILGGYGGQVPFVRLVQRDSEMQERIMAAVDELWRRIELRDPPPPDGSEASDRALYRLHRNEHPGLIVQLGEEAEQITAELMTIDKQRGALNKRRDALRQKLKFLIGDAHYGQLSDGSAWKWGTVKRKEYVVKATTHRDLRKVKAPK